MTSFLKRLSKASCDSPSLKVTVANTLTSFRILFHKQNPACALGQWIAAGFARLWLLTSALMPDGKDVLLYFFQAHCSAYMMSLLPNPRRQKRLDCFKHLPIAHCGADNRTIIADSTFGVKGRPTCDSRFTGAVTALTRSWLPTDRLLPRDRRGNDRCRARHVEL